MVTKSKKGMLNGSKTSKSKASVSTRGGTSAQHAKAGHLGGIAPHRCRGRQCSSNASSVTSGTTRSKSVGTNTNRKSGK